MPIMVSPHRAGLHSSAQGCRVFRGGADKAGLLLCGDPASDGNYLRWRVDRMVILVDSIRR
jgi:hypothetical protein